MSIKIPEQLNALIPMVVEQSSRGRSMIFTQDYLKKELYLLLVP